MEFRVHHKLREQIELEHRDIALITAPGMGLSTLLNNLGGISSLTIVPLDTELILHLWAVEYQSRKRHRRYIIHAAALSALIQSGILECNITDQELFKTNMPDLLKSNNFQPEYPLLIVIDDFDKLPTDLSLIICNEMKSLDDMRTEASYEAMRAIRFAIGGSIDFSSIYKTKVSSGVSPATNFKKYFPYQFMLSPDEGIVLLDTTIPEFTKLENELRNLVIDWAGGYLHYVLEFARFVLAEKRDIHQLSVPSLVVRVKDIVEEQDRIPVFRYCYSSWSEIKEVKSLVDLLAACVSVGRVYDASGQGRLLSNMGLLLENRIQRNVFYPANKLIEIFLRQRLAEMDMVLSIENSAIWVISSLNIQAYALLLEIENQLRNFIGDRLFAQYGASWMDDCMEAIRSDDGKILLEKIQERAQQEQQNMFAAESVTDSFLTFLDFPDLGVIVKNQNGLFHEKFSENFPLFLSEFNYYRRRVAHNRPITLSQINSLDRRWRILQRSMFSRRLSRS